MKNKFPIKKYRKINEFKNDYYKIFFKTINQINVKDIETATKLILNKIKKKKNIFIAGNGGSAAISNHMLCDYLKFLRERSRLKPKFFSLSNSIELITAIANDINYNDIFSYQIQSNANKGDLIILISSSGNSKNIINAIKAAKEKNMYIMSLTGFDGGFVKKNSNLNIHCAVKNYAISEDIHHSVLHLICQYLSQMFLKENIVAKTKF
tara:strand:- start:7556 stop:8182 length:627 start_codon:yes stop_codon:yes gene_type:complete